MSLWKVPTMNDKYSRYQIAFSTIVKATQGDETAMQEIIKMYRAYMIKLSMNNGVLDRELYERLVRKLMLAVVKFKIDYEEK